MEKFPILIKRKRVILLLIPSKELYKDIHIGEMMHPIEQSWKRNRPSHSEENLKINFSHYSGITYG